MYQIRFTEANWIIQMEIHKSHGTVIYYLSEIDYLDLINKFSKKKIPPLFHLHIIYLFIFDSKFFH